MAMHHHGCSEKFPDIHGKQKMIEVGRCTLRAGIAQGCPISALIFCLFLELRIAIITLRNPSPVSPGGTFLRIAYMDFTTFVLDNADDMQQLSDRKMLASLYTHLHTSIVKLTGIVASMIGGKVQCHSQIFRAGGSTLTLLHGNDRSRLLGRHILPHIFHRQDYIKLLLAGRRASVALRFERLPANYPLLMYNASTGGTQRWIAGVRPPAHATMCLCDFAAASAIRATANWGPLRYFHAASPGWMDRHLPCHSDHPTHICDYHYQAGRTSQPSDSQLCPTWILESSAKLSLRYAMRRGHIWKDVPCAQYRLPQVCSIHTLHEH